MKVIIIIVCIIFLVFGSAFSIQKFLNKGTDDLVNNLEDLKNEVENNNIEKNELTNKSDEIYKKWKDINEKWATIVLHGEMDLIETSLIRMKSKIDIGNIDESIEDINTSIFLLKHIKEKEKTSLKNIF